ncbi:MAG: N-acetyltransferase [Ruminococcus callidus]|nr:N-acetyltransferase [Ruminococcus callidus]
MVFQIENNRIFQSDETGKILAEITFPEIRQGVYCIDHTFVDDSLRGQGVAGQLVQLAVRKIQEQGGKVTATCSYAQHWLKKHQDEI